MDSNSIIQQEHTAHQSVIFNLLTHTTNIVHHDSYDSNQLPVVRLYRFDVRTDHTAALGEYEVTAHRLTLFGLLLLRNRGLSAADTE